MNQNFRILLDVFYTLHSSNIEQADAKDLTLVLGLWSWCEKQRCLANLPSMSDAVQTKPALEALHLAVKEMTAGMGFEHLVELIDYNFAGKEIKQLLDKLVSIKWQDEVEWIQAMQHFAELLMHNAHKAFSVPLGQFIKSLLGEFNSLKLEGMVSASLLPFLTTKQASLLAYSSEYDVYLQCLAFAYSAQSFCGQDPINNDQQAEVIVSFPQINEKLNTKRQGSYISNLHDVASVEAASLHSSSKAIILTANRFLSSRAKSDLETRQKLLQQNILDAVILLPSPIHPLKSAISLVMVVINHQRQQGDPVTFFDASLLPSYSNINASSKQSELDVFVQEMQQAWQEPNQHNAIAQASLQDIKHHQYNLSFSLYAMSETVKEIEQLRERPKSQVAVLEDLVTIIRAQNLQPKATIAAANSVIEIGQTNVNERGYVQLFGHENIISINDKNQRQIQKQTLQKDDILIVSKGHAGVVALVGDDCADNWVAGQAYIILRAKAGVSVAYLFRYLRSFMVQEYFDHVAQGAAVKVLTSETIAKLPVPLLTEKQLATINDEYKQIQAKYDEIDRLKKEIEALSAFDYLVS